MDENDHYTIRDWVPIWVDGGKRLSTLLDEMREANAPEGSFRVISVLIHYHIARDLELARLAAEMLGPISVDPDDGMS